MSAVGCSESCALRQFSVQLDLPKPSLGILGGGQFCISHSGDRVVHCWRGMMRPVLACVQIPGVDTYTDISVLLSCGNHL